MTAALAWVVGNWRLIVIAGLLSLLGLQTVRLAEQRSDTAAARADLADYRATAAESGRLAERAQRTQEQTWRDRVDGVIQDGQLQIARARDDADRAGAAERRVRDQLAAYRAAVRRASAETSTSEGGAPADDPIGVLADVLGRADRRAGILAAFADAAHAAGTICQRYADSIAN